jgi:pimeloyl-ACP methyl ester carboxylesterase
MSRGTSSSSGSPSEAALFDDAEVIFDSIRDDHVRISVIGRSLGSGVAVHIASVRDVHKLVLVTPYDSIASVAKTRFAVFPVSLLLKDKFDSLSKAAAIDSPTMILLAERDHVIPHGHSQRLLTAFPPEDVQAQMIQGTTHDSIVAAEEYRRALHDFLRI